MHARRCATPSRQMAPPRGFATHSASFASGTKPQVYYTYGQLELPTNFTPEKATNTSNSVKLGKTNTVLAENNSCNTALKERLALFFFFKLAHDASSSLRQCSAKVAPFWWPPKEYSSCGLKQKSPDSRASGSTDFHRDGVLLGKF